MTTIIRTSTNPRIGVRITGKQDFSLLVSLSQSMAHLSFETFTLP